MRLIFILITLGLFFCSCTNKRTIRKSVEEYNYTYFKTYENVFGKVKSIYETSYVIVKQNGDSVKIKPIYYTIYNYDPKGHEQRIISENKDGSQHWRADNLYDDYGNLSRINYYNDLNELRFKIIYSYDERGFLVGFSDYSSGESSVSKTVYKNDKSGLPIEVVHNDARGNTSSFTLKYDKYGNVSEQCSYQPQNILLSKVDIEHDETGKEIKIVIYNLDGTINIIIKNKYRGKDAQGNWLEKFVYENDTPINKIERKLEYW